MAVQVKVYSWLLCMRYLIAPSILLRACMRQCSILMEPARGLMFLNRLKTVFCGQEMCQILKGIWETARYSGDQCRVPPPFVSSRWSLQWLCWSSYPSWREFSPPSWWNIFGASCSKERPALGLPGIADDRALAVGGILVSACFDTHVLNSPVLQFQSLLMMKSCNQ